MASSEVHEIRLIAKDGASRVFKEVGRAAQDAGQQAEKAATKASKATTDWADKSRVAGLAITAGLGLSVKRATDLSETINKSNVVFGKNAATMLAWSKTSATAMGISQQAALETASSFGNLFTTMGLGPQATADMSQELVELASDLSSFNNIPTDLVLEKLRAGLVGEIEPLRSLGVQINEAAVQAELMRMGIEKVNGVFTESDKVLARYNLILAQTGTAQGDFARTSDGLANQTRIARAELDNAAATIGVALIPAVTTGVSVVADMASGFAQLPQPVQTATAAVGAMSAGLLLIAPQAAKTIEVFKGMALGSRVLGLAMGPVGIAAAAAAAAAGIYLLVRSLDSGDDSLTRASANVTTLQESIVALQQGGAPRAVTEAIAGYSDEIQNLARVSVDASDQLERVRIAGLEYAEMWDRARASGDEAAAAVAEQQVKNLNALAEALDKDILKGEEFIEVQKDIAEIISEPNALNSGLVQERLAGLFAEFESGAITADELAWNINWLNENSDTYGLTLEELGRQQEAVGNEMADSTVNADKLAANMKKVAKANTDARDASEQLNTDLQELAVTLARDMPNAASASFDQVVGFTGGIVDSIEKTKDWTDAMTGVLGTDFMDDGTWSTLRRMVDEGAISWENYSDAVDAQVSIYDDLNRATNAANEIQLKQIDILADGTKASADYLEQIAALPEHEQALALAWADTDIAERANQIADLAGEFDNMGAAQQDAFGSMVTSAAATDPQLARVLQNLGLIEKDLTDPTGWRLAIDDTDAAAALSNTDAAIGDLITVLGVAYDLDIDAILDTSNFWTQYNALPDDHYINVRYNVGPIPAGALGGMVPYGDYDTAALGRMDRGRATLVGEHGPELLSLPGGSSITPNHATQYMMRGQGGITINGPITVVANDPQTFIEQMRDYSRPMVRP
jgi:hypothetical protein